ncbi:hypothetical protein B5807_05008 [Epicoccum nigrum]|uniref:Uncharacterized protein n=1 Tax=Epicoccum nigrum TaxID=105696 RepID=A0A1Y2M4Z9_EPING|nr:hypothetical protein B5807_05008 [Epicoccum nigrum]
MAIPDSTDPADEEIMETNPEEESVETGEQESMETDLKEETVGTDDEDDSDTDFVPASNDCGLCQLPIHVPPSCLKEDDTDEDDADRGNADESK